MNFKTPFKVLTTAALIGTLSLSAVAPGAASAANATTAQSVKSETADHAVDYVVLVNSKGELGKLSFDEYVALEIKGEEALFSALGDFTIKYIVTGNGNVYDLNDFAEEEIKSQGKDVPASELLKNLDDKDAELDAKVIEDAKETKIEDGKVVIDETAEDFKVTEIAAINKTGVTLNIEKLTQDVEGATITVKDNKGNVVEVTPLNLVINETVANFKFKTALTADPTGVWTVEGISFDTDVAAKLAAINGAGANELKLYNALTAAGIKNLKVENSGAYLSADKPAEGFKTLAEVQAFVEKVNAEQTTDAEKQEQVKELVTLLSASTPSQVQVLAALAPFERVNADFIANYITELKTTNAISNSTPFKTVQKQIDDVNVDGVTTLVSNAKGDAKRATYTKAVAAMKFVREDDAKVPTDKVKANLQKDLDQLNLVLNVKEASTAAQFVNAYDALVANVDNKTTIGTEKVYTDLRTDYMAATKVVAGAESIKTAADIEAAILKTNTQKRAELFNDVANIVNTPGATQTKPEDVLKKLNALAAYADKADFDIETVSTTESRLESYRALLATLSAVDATAYTGAAAPGAVTTLIKSVQTQITTANNTAVTTPLDKIAAAASTQAGDLFHDGTSAITEPAEKADALLAELKNPELALGNVVDANAAAYLTDIASIQAAATVGGGTAADSVKALKTAVKDINLLVDINKATTAAEVSTALLALSGNTAYINIPSADRLWVAGKVLDARNAVDPAKKFANVAAVKSALTIAAGLQGTALTAVNDLTVASTITNVIDALKLVDADYAKKSTAEQSQIAEDFFLGLKFAETAPGKVTPPFRTLAAVKTAAGL